MNIVKTLLCT